LHVFQVTPDTDIGDTTEQRGEKDYQEGKFLVVQ